MDDLCWCCVQQQHVPLCPTCYGIPTTSEHDGQGEGTSHRSVHAYRSANQQGPNWPGNGKAFGCISKTLRGFRSLRQRKLHFLAAVRRRFSSEDYRPHCSSRGPFVLPIYRFFERACEHFCVNASPYNRSRFCLGLVGLVGTS